MQITIDTNEIIEHLEGNYYVIKKYDIQTIKSLYCDIIMNHLAQVILNYVKDWYDKDSLSMNNGTINTKYKDYLPNAPWTKLNQSFEKLGFEYKLKDDFHYSHQMFQLKEQPALIDKNGAVRQVSELSDGEKAKLLFAIENVIN